MHKFGLLILRKIITILATRCQILRLKCTKFYFGWGSAPDPAAGAYSTPSDSPAGFKGPTSKGRNWEGRERREGQAMWKESVGEKRGREEKGNLPPLKFRFGYGIAYDPPYLKVWLWLGSILSSERPSPNIWLATGLKLAYYGHTMRKQGSCLEKEIMQGTMPGACRRGRPARPGLATSRRGQDSL